MTFQIGNMAPDFQAQSTSGDIRFYDWLGDGWAVMLVYPRALTAECFDELHAIEALRGDFDRIGCKVMGLVTTDANDFDAWAESISQLLGRSPYFPFASYGAADTDDFGAANGHASAARTLVVIGPDKRVKLVIAYPVVTASMFEEILRLIESLQYAGERRLLKPSFGEDDLIVLPGAVEDNDADRGGFSECGPINGQQKHLPQRNHC